MKARLTTCLTALLLLTAVFGVPVARVSVDRIAIYAVYSERKQIRSEQAAEIPEPPRFPAPACISAAPQQSGAAPILDYARFQRPPPSSIA